MTKHRLSGAQASIVHRGVRPKSATAIATSTQTAGT